MEYRYLGATGLQVSTVALGTWTFGWSVDRADAVALLNLAREAGCNFIDTADRYGRPKSPAGTAEEWLGDWLASQRREQIVLATKVRGRMGLGPNDEGLSRHYLLRAIEASLRRLKTDYIDLYQIHWPDPGVPLEETLRALETIVTQGKARYLGCSNFPAWLLCRALWISEMRGWNRLEATQVQYSLVHRAEYERELQPLCVDQRVGVLAYSPLGEGFLTGKYEEGQQPLADTRAAQRAEVANHFSSRKFALLRQVQQMAASTGLTPAQGALAWVLGQSAVTAAVVGARRPSQLAENLAAAGIRLTAEAQQNLDQASAWDDDRTPLAIL